MTKLLLTIITLLTITNIANATTKENFICRDLGLSKIRNNMVLVESEPYILKLDATEDYYIKDKEIKKIFIGQVMCAKKWDDSSYLDGYSFNYYFNLKVKQAKQLMEEDFNKKMLNNMPSNTRLRSK